MSKKIDRVEAKKRELEANLERIQSGLETNLESVKMDVTQSISPTEVVRKYPIQVVGMAVVAGFFLTRIGNKRSQKSTTKNVVTDSITNSLKKRLSRKATDFVLDYIENRITQKNENE